MTLREAGIQSLNLAYASGKPRDNNGNLIAEVGSFTRDDGTESLMADALFRTAAPPDRIA
jgi:hypothetical protein